MGAISWIVDSLLYEEAIAVAEEEQRLREREATPAQREQDKEDGVDDQVSWQLFRVIFFFFCTSCCFCVVAFFSVACIRAVGRGERCLVFEVRRFVAGDWTA